MDIINSIFFILGGITVFLTGLKFLREGAENLSEKKIKGLIKTSSKNSVMGVFTGCLSTALLESSVATNMITIAFVEKGILSFYSACAVVMGTNIGTTITAQIVSFSSLSEKWLSGIFNLTAFIGFLFWQKDKKMKNTGKLLMGIGFIFIGLELITNCVEILKGYSWFKGLFLVKNPMLLLLNGFFITAVLQSSSVVTSMLIVLANLGLLDFKSAIYLILGANIGSCMPVILGSLKVGLTSKKVAYFNLFFNLVGSLIFFVPFSLFSKSGAFCHFMEVIFSGNISRNIANFHTLFNVIICIIFLPFLKYAVKVVDGLCNFLYLKKGKNPSKGVKKIGCNREKQVFIKY